MASRCTATPGWGISISGPPRWCAGGGAADPPDYVLLCVKVVEGVDRIGLLRDAVGPATAIVLICNGVEVESGIAEGFPQHELISGLAFICVTRLAPGRIWHQAYGRLALGNYPSGVSAKTQALAAAFARSGIACVTSDTIVTARWQKCLWNAAFNPLSVLSGGLATGDILAHQETLVRALMAEVAQIAQAVGHPLPPMPSTGTSTAPARCPRTRPACCWISRPGGRWKPRRSWATRCGPGGGPGWPCPSWKPSTP